MLRYFNQIVSDGCTYSIDKLIIKGSFNKVVRISPFPGEYVEVPFLYEFQQILFRNDDRMVFQHFDGSGFMRYKDSWKIDFGNDSVAYFAFGLNGYSGSDLTRWKVEFNPNKSFPNALLDELINFCVFNSSSPYISEFDIAVDVPIPREDFFFIKDNRKYQLVMNSQTDKTEYLGNRHEMGYCKLYNKQIESKLDYPLTRFELTVSVDNSEEFLSFTDIVKRVPEIYYFTSMQMSHDEMALTGTDRILLEYALQNPLVLSMFGKNSRKMCLRLRGLMDAHIKRLELNKDILLKLYQWINNYV